MKPITELIADVEKILEDLGISHATEPAPEKVHASGAINTGLKWLRSLLPQEIEQSPSSGPAPAPVVPASPPLDPADAPPANSTTDPVADTPANSEDGE